MAIVDADLNKGYSAQTVLELRERTLFLTLIDRSYEARWNSGESHIYIAKPDYAQNDTPNPDEGVVASSRSRGGNWAAARRMDADQVDFTRTGGYSTSMEILQEDALELSWPIVEETFDRQQYEMRRQIDRGIYANFKSDITSANETAYGTAGTNYIDRTAPYAPAGTGNTLVYQAVKDFSLKAKRANAGTVEGSPAGRGWIVMPPELSSQLQDYMLSEKHSFDPLTSSILEQRSLLADAEFDGRLFGVDIYSWNGIAVPTGTDDWELLAGMQNGSTGGIRTPITQRFTPEQNQVSSAPAHLARIAGDFAHVLLREELFTQITIAAD